VWLCVCARVCVCVCVCVDMCGCVPIPLSPASDDIMIIIMSRGYNKGVSQGLVGSHDDAHVTVMVSQSNGHGITE
jgi:hypothetical protein